MFGIIREGLEEEGEERDVKWLQGSASSADMHLGGREIKNNAGGSLGPERRNKRYLNHNIFKKQ